MTKHEIKACPRCETAFECKAGSIELCQCRTITLSDEVHQFIHEAFADCLCVNCLASLRSDYYQKKFEATVKKALGSR